MDNTTAHSLAMQEDPDVSFSFAEEDEEQNHATPEKLAVRLFEYPSDVSHYHIANP